MSLGIGANVGVGGKKKKKKKEKKQVPAPRQNLKPSLGPSAVTSSSPSLSSGLSNRTAKTPDMHIGMIAGAYKKQTGLNPSPSKMWDLVSGTMNGVAIPMDEDGITEMLAPGANWYKDFYQKLQTKALVEGWSKEMWDKSFTTYVGHHPELQGDFSSFQRLWGEQLTRSGEQTVSVEKSLDNNLTKLKSKNKTVEFEDGMPVEEQTSSAMKILSNIPVIGQMAELGAFPGAKSMIEDAKMTYYPGVKKPLALLKALQATDEAGFRKGILGDGTRPCITEDMSTQEMLNIVVFGQYIRNAIDGDKTAEAMVRSTGLINPQSSMQDFKDSFKATASSSSEENLKKAVYLFELSARDPRQSELEFNAQYAKNERWAPEDLKAKYTTHFWKRATNTVASAFTDATGLGLLSYDAEAMREITDDLASQKDSKISFIASAALDPIADILSGSSKAATTAVTIPMSLSYGTINFYWDRVGGKGMFAKSKEDRIKAGILLMEINDSKTPEEALAKANAMDWYRYYVTTERGPVTRFAEELELDQDNPFIGIGLFVASLTLDGIIGGIADRVARPIASKLKARASYSLYPEKTPAHLISSLTDDLPIYEMLKNSGVYVPRSEWAHIAKLAETGEVEKVATHTQALKDVYGLDGLISKYPGLDTPTFTTYAIYKKYTDPNIPLHQRSLLLPASSEKMWVLNDDLPSRVFTHAIHANKPLREALQWSTKVMRAMGKSDEPIEIGKVTPRRGSTHEEAISSEVASIIDDLNKSIADDLTSLPSSKGYREKKYAEEMAERVKEGEDPASIVIDKGQWTLYNELLDYEKRQRGEGSERQTVYAPDPETGMGSMSEMSMAIRKGTRDKLWASLDETRELNKKKAERLRARKAAIINKPVDAAQRKFNTAKQKHAQAVRDLQKAKDAKKSPAEKKALDQRRKERLDDRLAASKELAAARENARLQKKAPTDERIIRVNETLAAMKNADTLGFLEVRDLLTTVEGMEKHGESVPLVESQLGNHGFFEFDDRTLGMFNAGEDMVNLMARQEKLGLAADPLGRNWILANEGTWYRVVNDAFDAAKATLPKNIGRKSDLLQHAGLDQYTQARKKMVLARVATVLNFVLGDEGVRAFLTSGEARLVKLGNLPQTTRRLVALFSNRLQKDPRWSGVKAELEALIGDDPIMREKFATSLFERSSRMLRNERWEEVSPGQKGFIKGMRIMLKLFNAQRSRIVSDWLRIYDAEKGSKSAAPLEARVRTKWQEHVLNDPYYAESGQPGFEFLDATGRYPSLSQPSYGMTLFLDAVHKRAFRMMEHTVTAEQLRTGKFGSAKGASSLAVQEIYGKVMVPTAQYRGAWNRNVRARLEEKVELGKYATKEVVKDGKTIIVPDRAKRVATRAVAEPIANMLTHPYDTILGLADKLGTNLKRELLASYYDLALKRIKERHPTLPEEEAIGMAFDMAKHFTEKASYMATHTLFEEKLRNAVMFLPAYRQFAQYWTRKAAENPFKTAAILKNMSDMPDFSAWIPIIGPLSWVTNNIGFFSGISDPQRALPGVGFAITDPLQVASMLGSDDAEDMYTAISGGYGPGYPWWGDIADDLMWVVSDGNFDFARVADLLPGPGAEGAEYLEYQRNKMIIAELTRQCVEDGFESINVEAATNNVKLRYLGKAMLKEVLPGNVKLQLPDVKVNGRRVSLERILEGQKAYLSAEGDPAKAQALSLYPEYAPIAKARILSGDAQLKYLSTNKWVIPFVVRQSEIPSGVSDDVAAFYDDVSGAKVVYTPAEIADEIKGKYKDVLEYELQVSYAKAKAISDASVEKDPLVKKAKKVGTEFYEQVKSQAEQAAEQKFLSDFENDNRKKLKAVYTEDQIRSHGWVDKMGMSSSNPQGWAGIYQAMKTMEEKKLPGWEKILSESKYYSMYEAEKEETEKKKRKLILEFATSMYHNEMYQTGTDKVTLEPGREMYKEDALIEAMGANKLADQNAILKYFRELGAYEKTINKLRAAGHTRDKEYRAAQVAGKKHLAQLRSKNKYLRRGLADWLKVIGYDKEEKVSLQTPEGREDNALKISSMNEKVKKLTKDLNDGNYKSLMDFFGKWEEMNKSLGTSGNRARIDEFNRALAWWMLLDIGDSGREHLLKTPNSQGWYGNSLESGPGEQVSLRMEWLYKQLRKVSPEFARECDTDFKGKKIWKLIIDPERW